jgi:two-component system NarL family response regulator
VPEVPDVPVAVAPVRVLVVDDHALFRCGIVIVLESEDGIELAGEAEDGATALRRAVELVPDIVLMDVRMPVMGGIEAARRMAEEVPSARVVMLTVSDDEADLFEAIKAGAAGYLLKEIAVEGVAEAVHAVMRGHTLISPSMAGKLLTEFTSLANGDDDAVQGPLPRLTGRELEVLGLVAKGLTNREVGVQLQISENTAKNHVRNILEKLHLHSRMEAVLYAVREELLQLG